MPPTQQQRIDALEAAVEAMRTRQDAADKVREDTHKRVQDMQGKVDAMFAALMQPQVGHGDKSLVERMAEVTVNIEAAQRTGENLGTLARWLAAMALAGGLLIALLKFGHNPNP
jgi:septal ring factor EnvC (AmiA/AmiB activator)